MKTKCAFAVLIACGFALCGHAIAQAPTAPSGLTAGSMSTEDRARSAYAHLSYATEIRAVTQAVDKNPQINAADLQKIVDRETVRYEIETLSTGPISQIADRKYWEMVDRPNGGPQILASMDSTNFTHEGSKPVVAYSSRAKWIKEGVMITDGYDLTVGKVMTFDPGFKAFTEYAALKVTVNFEGKDRTYNALFLCGTSCVAADNVTNQSAVSFFETVPVYPVLLMMPEYRHAAVEQWLENGAMDGTADSFDAICDLKALKCGVARSVLDPKILKEKVQGDAKPPGSNLRSATGH